MTEGHTDNSIHKLDAGVENLHAAWIPDEAKSTWYTVIHEIIPTNERLHTIRLVVSTATATSRNKIDSCNV